MEQIKNCYTCGHSMDRYEPSYMKCALNGGAYCEYIKRYRNSECQWVEREPTLLELISTKLKSLF